MPELLGNIPIGADTDVIFGKHVNGVGAHDSRDGSALNSMAGTWTLEEADGTELGTGNFTFIENGKYRASIGGAITAAVEEGSAGNAASWLKLTLAFTNPIDKRVLWLLPVHRGKT